MCKIWIYLESQSEVKRSKCVDKQYKHWNNWEKRQVLWKIRELFRAYLSHTSKSWQISCIMPADLQWLYKEKFENKKKVLWNLKSKDKQYNGHKKRDKGTHNDLQNTTYKTKDWATRISLKPGGNGLRYKGCCSATLIKKYFPMISLFYVLVIGDNC
jgi:hypothetical protein